MGDNLLTRVLIFFALLITCKGTDSLLKLTEEEIAEIQRHHAGADIDMAIDPGFNLHISASHFLPAEPGELIGATIELESYSNIELSAPDASGIASPTEGLGGVGEIPTGKWLRVDLKNHDGQLCKVVVKDKLHTGIVFQLYRPDAELKYKDGSLVRDQILYSSSDAEETGRICIDDKIVPMRALNTVIGSYGVGGSLPEKDLQERVHAFKAVHKEFLETDRDDVQEFMLRTKMLDGHFALRDKLDKKYENDDLIRSVLGAFISDKHNMMPSKDILQDGEPLALKMTKTAVAGMVSRFLMYQQVFNADEFAVVKFDQDFDNIDWHADLAPMVASIKNNYPTDIEGMKVFSNVDDLRDSLSYRIDQMTKYIRESAKTDGCETHVEDLFQGIQNPELYVKTLKEADTSFSYKTFESKIGDVEGMLLMTTEGLTTTKLHEVCKNLANTDFPIGKINAEDLPKIVEKLKSNVLKTLANFNDEYAKKADKEDYLSGLIRKRTLALPPVLTFSDNNNIDEIVDPLVQANKDAINKEKSNAFWDGIREGFAKVVGLIGIVAVVAGIVSVFGFLPAAGIASFAAIISMVGTALLVPSYTVEWLHERNDYRSLESNILSGGSADFKDQAKHLHEFRSARNEAFLSGAFVVLGAVPVASFARNPRALLVNPKDMAKGIWGASTRPFRWTGSTVKGVFTRSPLKTASMIRDNIKTRLQNIGKGINTAKIKVQGLKKGKIKGVAANEARKSISQFLKDGATSIKKMDKRCSGESTSQC